MGTIKRRFDSIKIDRTKTTAVLPRNTFTTKGIEEAISGVILFPTRSRTKASDWYAVSPEYCQRRIHCGHH